MPLKLRAGCVRAAAESTSPSRARPANAVRQAALYEKRISRLLVGRAIRSVLPPGKCGRPEGAGRPRANPDGGRTGTLFRLLALRREASHYVIGRRAACRSLLPAERNCSKTSDVGSGSARQSFGRAGPAPRTSLLACALTMTVRQRQRASSQGAAMRATSIPNKLGRKSPGFRAATLWLV